MDSGVFEPVSRNCTKFDDTLLKFYRFKRAYLTTDTINVHSKDDNHIVFRDRSTGASAITENESSAKR